MTADEVNAIFSLLDINKDGKLNYAEVSLFAYQVTYSLTSCCHIAINRSALTVKPLMDEVNDDDHGCGTMFKWKTMAPGFCVDVLWPLKRTQILF